MAAQKFGIGSALIVVGFPATSFNVVGMACVEPRSEHSDRLVVVIPGIGGSVLQSADGRGLWDAVPGAAARLLRRPEMFAIDRPVVPVGLIGRVLFPGLTKIHGYGRLLGRIHGVVGRKWGIDYGHPSQRNDDARVVAFPYDFRRSVVESAARLDDEITRRMDHLGWRKEPDRVIIVAHSLGGLVARYWMAQNNWEVCQGLITLGTPHRGAPKALEWLVNGAPWWTGARFRLRDLLRTWPSMYELIPRYRSIQVDGPSLSDDDEDGFGYPMHLPHDWLGTPARDAYKVHLDIEREWNEHHNRTGCLAFVGRGHATPGQASWNGSTLVTTKAQPRWLNLRPDVRGDGTVPEFSAVPIEQSKYLKHEYLSASHTGMLTADETLRALESLLKSNPAQLAKARNLLPSMIGLDIEDAYVARTSFDVLARFDPAGTEPAQVELAYDLLTGGATIHSGRFRAGESWSATLSDLNAGDYELRVRAEPAGAYPHLVTSEWFTVLDETPEARATDALVMVEAAQNPATSSANSPTLSLTPDQLREIAVDLRAKRIPADEHLAAVVEAEVAAYRTYDRHPRPLLPPADLAERLPLLGWVIYEYTFVAMDLVEPAYESLPRDRKARSAAVEALITRVADAGRQLPWPEFAPRSLGAIRAQALVASKRDTVPGYALAWALHEEARATCSLLAECHLGRSDRGYYLLALDEVLLQLALSETGTACRTAEQVIGRWAEGLDRTWHLAEDPAWAQRMFRELHAGVRVGQEAIGIAKRVDDDHGLVHDVDERRLVQVTAYRNPGIMTARAALLMLSLCQHMEELGRLPIGDHDSWGEQRAALLADFTNAYQTTEKEVIDKDGRAMPLSGPHARSMVQLRLHFALLQPGSTMPTRLDFHPCVQRDVLDEEAIEGLSSWLTEKDDGKQRGDANVIGSATMPSFIRSVEAYRLSRGVGAGYREWRLRWFELDRYASEPNRREHVENVLRSVESPTATTPNRPDVAGPEPIEPKIPQPRAPWWTMGRRHRR